MMYLKAFIVGGLICVVGQILIDKTKLTAGRILTMFVSLGTVLTVLGIYGPLVDFAGAGATVPITGFGYALGKGVMDEVRLSGFIGAFTGGLKATAGGLSAAILFGFLAAVIFNSKPKQ